METRRGFHNCVLCISIGRDNYLMPYPEIIMHSLLIQRVSVNTVSCWDNVLSDDTKRPRRNR
jgi:hypothetical protein